MPNPGLWELYPFNIQHFLIKRQYQRFLFIIFLRCAKHWNTHAHIQTTLCRYSYHGIVSGRCRSNLVWSADQQVAHYPHFRRDFVVKPGILAQTIFISVFFIYIIYADYLQLFQVCVWSRWSPTSRNIPSIQWPARRRDDRPATGGPCGDILWHELREKWLSLFWWEHGN